MKTIFFSIAFISMMMLVNGCTKSEPGDGGNFHLVFRPRLCEDIQIIPGKFVKSTTEHGVFYNPVTLGYESVDASKYLITIFTGNLSLMSRFKKFYDSSGYYSLADRGLMLPKMALEENTELAEGNANIETQLDADYRAYSKNVDKGLILPYANSFSSTTPRTTLKPWQYRLTGISDFKITSNSTLYGLPIGSDLSDYFSIYNFTPRQIVSYTNDQLVWGYNDTKKIESISRWLSLKPYAPPKMSLKMISVPADLPDEIDFTITITTTDGKIIKETTHVKFAK